MLTLLRVTETSMDSVSRRAALEGVVAALACAWTGLGRPDAVRAEPLPFGKRLADAALAQCGITVLYDPAYARVAYPLGDVPEDRGVCADVVIRAYRTLGIDLQERVHKDMTAHFSLYPHLWALRGPDSNIDHRRVPNLETYFRRFGQTLPSGRDSHVYAEGDLVTWRLDGHLPHIGIVTAALSVDGARPLVVHNVGAGARHEDALFAYPLAGHFRYTG